MGAGEVPGAEAVWADPSNYRAANRLTYACVVVHVTDGHASARPVAEMWRQPNHGSSAHFVVGQDGAVLQCVRLKDVAYHAHAANGRSVGVEHCCRTPKELGADDPGLPPSPELYAASAKLVAHLLKAAGLLVDRSETLLGHREADPATTHFDCPDGAWDWGVYLSLVDAEYAKLDAFPVG